MIIKAPNKCEIKRPTTSFGNHFWKSVWIGLDTTPPATRQRVRSASFTRQPSCPAWKAIVSKPRGRQSCSEFCSAYGYAGAQNIAKLLTQWLRRVRLGSQISFQSSIFDTPTDFPKNMTATDILKCLFLLDILTFCQRQNMTGSDVQTVLEWNLCNIQTYSDY